MSAVTKTGGRDATTAVVPGRGLLSIGNPKTPEPEGYQWTELAEVARMESGHTPSRTKSEYWNEGIPWIGVKDATGNDGQIIRETLQSVSQLGVDNSSTRLLPAGTVCLSRTASVGYVVQMGVPMCTSQDFVNWVCGPALNPSYLRYLILAEAESVRSWATGSTHKTLYFPEAKALHALLPAARVQDRVVEVLGALDDKIAVNRRLESSLWQMVDAQAKLASSVDPTVVALGGLVRLNYGRALPVARRRGGGVAVMGSGGEVGRHDEALVSGPSVIVGRKGSVGATYWVDGPVYPIDTTYWVEPIEVPLLYVYAVLKGVDFSGMSTDSAVPGLNRERAYAIPVTLPTPEKLRTFELRTASLVRRATAASDENLRLAATRDELLPLLMSGKITVKDAEKTVEEVI